jgi:chromosome segregation ATPase
LIQAEIYKADFLEERKDREIARGELEDLRKKKGGEALVFHEQVAALQKEIDEVRRERNHLKKSFAGGEAKYRDELATAGKVIANFQKQVEGITKERDHWKYQFDNSKDSIKKMDKMRDDMNHWKQEYMSAKESIDGLRKQMEKMGSERDNLKRQAEQKKKSKTPTEKEHKKLKQQVSTP